MHLASGWQLRRVFVEIRATAARVSCSTDLIGEADAVVVPWVAARHRRHGYYDTMLCQFIAKFAISRFEHPDKQEER